jgi:hypothetical protein
LGEQLAIVEIAKGAKRPFKNSDFESMTASADNIVDLTVAIAVEIGINANKQTTHDSLTLQCHAARLVLGSQGTSKEEKQKKQASHVISMSIGFLKGGFDAIDVTGISSRPRRKEKVQGWTRPAP